MDWNKHRAEMKVLSFGTKKAVGCSWLLGFIYDLLLACCNWGIFNSILEM